MTLSAKFNITLLAVFAVGLVITATVVRQQLDDHAKKVTVDTAGLMMESSMAVRKYTADQIRPLLAPQLDVAFHPQTVPAYSATQMFNSLREQLPEFTYKEATLNPSNPIDRATDWEADIVEYFRNHPDQKERVGERASATGNSLFIARPIKVSNKACLQCHGDPKDLPKTVKDKYGDSQGLGWTMNEVVGAQIAAVPTSVADKRAQAEFDTFLGLLIGVFTFVMVVLNVLLNKIVIAPIKKMASFADKASTGDMSGGEIAVSGDDEISVLASSFNRMTRSLKKAMEMIDGE